MLSMVTSVSNDVIPSATRAAVCSKGTDGRHSRYDHDQGTRAVHVAQEVTIGTFEGEVGVNTRIIAYNADVTCNLRYQEY